MNLELIATALLPAFFVLLLGYGCAGYRVATRVALAEALRTALAQAGPTVLAVPISPALPPLV